MSDPSVGPMRPVPPTVVVGVRLPRTVLEAVESWRENLAAERGAASRTDAVLAMLAHAIAFRERQRRQNEARAARRRGDR